MTFLLIEGNKDNLHILYIHHCDEGKHFIYFAGKFFKNVHKTTVQTYTISLTEIVTMTFFFTPSWKQDTLIIIHVHIEPLPGEKKMNY